MELSNYLIRNCTRVKSIDITAKDRVDLRDTHFGKDLIYTVSDNEPFMMEIEDREECRRTIRRTNKRTPLEFHIDIDTDQLSEKALDQVIDILEKEVSLDISTQDLSSGQLGLFEAFPDDDIE